MATSKLLLLSNLAARMLFTTRHIQFKTTGGIPAGDIWGTPFTGSLAQDLVGDPRSRPQWETAQDFYIGRPCGVGHERRPRGPLGHEDAYRPHGMALGAFIRVLGACICSRFLGSGGSASRLGSGACAFVDIWFWGIAFGLWGTFVDIRVLKASHRI
ncbi:hypothetical protein B0H13DRAFT_2473151 [Mycena leptocephala]|nr:hypothetical protein B0H13DRAFT_2473151 [Mycena leptocephala]